MTPTQRAAALRLADALDADCMVVGYDEVAALLRELAAEPQGEPLARIRVWSKISRFTGQPECHAELVDFEDSVETLPEGEHVLYAHPPQRQEPQGEPVAWRVRRKDCPDYWIIFLHFPIDAMQDPEREVQPLYIHPPQEAL